MGPRIDHERNLASIGTIERFSKEFILTIRDDMAESIVRKKEFLDMRPILPPGI